MILRMVVESDEYEPSEEAFLDQVQELRFDLREAGLREPEPSEPAVGKGAGEVTNIIEVLVAGGAGLTTISGLLITWMKNRGRRRLKLTAKRDGKVTEISLDAKNVSEEALLRFFGEDVPESK